MYNLTTILQIGGLFLIAMYLLHRVDILEEENEGLKDRIKRDKEWAEDYRYLSIESAIFNERLRVSHDEFAKKCEEFQKQCQEYHRQCEEIDKKYEVKKDEEGQNITR